MDPQQPTHQPNTPPPGGQPIPPPQPPSRQQYQRQAKRRKEGLRSVLSTVGVLISAPIIALLLIAFVFQSYEVDGPSMQHTLEHQDRLIVLKTGKTWSRITGEDYIPDRGEIIVFSKRGTVDPTAGGERQLIKRIVGMPNDRVTVRDGHITVYNDEHLNGFNPDEEGGYEDMIASRGGATDIDIHVPDGHVFVIGDNRSNSLDSRTFGIISSDEIVGTLALRIFPLNEIRSF